MRLQEIMSREVETIAPDLPAEVAWEVMARAGIRHLVVMEDGQLVGILSERDLGGQKGTSARRNRLVVELMTPHAVTAGPRATVREAANLLRGHVIGCLPIIDDGQVVGIVTTTDLLLLLGQGGEPRRQVDKRVLPGRGPEREQAAQRSRRVTAKETAIVPAGRGKARPG
jgi:acetoin utilization protein AcuB